MKWDQFDWTEERVEALKRHLADGPFTFCGHDSGGETYCAFHARVSVDRPAFAEAAE